MKTRLEIHTSATEFAKTLMDNLSLIELDTRIQKKATELKIDAEDYPLWKSEVITNRGRYISLSKQESPSAKAKALASARSKVSAPAKK